jgi:hypothetical protein
MAPQPLTSRGTPNDKQWPAPCDLQRSGHQTADAPETDHQRRAGHVGRVAAQSSPRKCISAARTVRGA